MYFILLLTVLNVFFLRATAQKVLSEYYAALGGRDALLEAWKEKKGEASAKKGKKRARTSTTNETPNGSKKSKKNGHPGSTTPPVSAKNAEFKPPSGNWEEHVVNIDACEGPEGAIVVYLTWKGGHKSQHPTAQVYKRCPQKVRKLASVTLIRYLG